MCEFNFKILINNCLNYIKFTFTHANKRKVIKSFMLKCYFKVMSLFSQNYN